MRLLLTAIILTKFAALIAEGGEVQSIAGTGKKGFSGDGGMAASAQMAEPLGITRGSDGALYFCDCENQRIRRIGKDGIISTVVGNGSRGYSGDGGPSVEAALNEPYEVRFDAQGDMIFVERLNHVVRKANMKTGIISTIAGCGKQGFDGDDGPAIKAHLNQPHSIAFDKKGDLYICDIANRRVRKVEMETGRISTFCGTGEKGPVAEGAHFPGTPLNGPRALDCAPTGNLWLALREGNSVYEFDFATATVRRTAGTGKSGFAGNGGPAIEATLSGPKGLAVAQNGNVYLADTESHSIRMIDTQSGRMELIAGTGQKGDGPDGDPLKCQFARPHGVFVDSDGAIYIGDTENYRIRVIRP